MKIIKSSIFCFLLILGFCHLIKAQESNQQILNHVAELAHPDFVTDMDYSTDGSYLLTGCKDKIARLWKFNLNGNAWTYELSKMFEENEIITSVVFSPDNQEFYWVKKMEQQRFGMLLMEGKYELFQTKHHLIT